MKQYVEKEESVLTASVLETIFENETENIFQSEGDILHNITHTSLNYLNGCINSRDTLI